MPAISQQETLNAEFWAAGEFIADYSNRILYPAEVLLMANHRRRLSGRTLEIGCGAGRILGYLVALGGDVHGIDISPQMVDYCRQAWPSAAVQVGDLAELGAPGESDGVKGPFDVMWAADSVLDVLDHDRRREVLEHWRTLLARDGLLIFSSHNLASLDARAEADRSGRIGLGDRLRRLLHRPPAQTLLSAAHWPRRARNRRRLRPLQTRAEDHAVINDLAHDYAILHYYVRRDAQQRMLRDSGYELIDCLELDGRTVAEGHDGFGPSLYYVARPSSKSLG